MKYRIEKYHTEHVSWTTGVSPRRICQWRIVRNSDNHIVESSIRTKKQAEWYLKGLPKDGWSK